MSWSKVLMLALGGALLAGPTWAQDDDDLLSPLGPSKKKPDSKAKPKPKPVVKPKPAPAKPGQPPPQASSDDDLAPLTPQKGELVLKLSAGLTTKRAKVTIDDKDAGTMPIAPAQLSPGEHTLSVRALGYAPWNKKITIAANRQLDLNVPLEPTAAVVSVTTNTAGAQVLINGRVIGTAPIEDLEVPPGNTTIAIRKEGYADATQTVKLVAGKDFPMQVKLGAPTAATTTTIVATDTDRPENTSLVPTETEPVGVTAGYEPSPPIYQRWYFWVGAVAVVAAVAVGTAVGVSSSTPKPLGEDKICGPRGCDACIGFMCTLMGTSTAIAPLKF